MTTITTIIISALCSVGPSDRLLDAIRQVESSGGVNLKGDLDKTTGEYRAIGPYQIWPITVRDTNRILGKEVYVLADRWDEKKSREMCKIILAHYEGKNGDEAMARRWNGGTNWQDKPKTIEYWEQVKQAMK
jgi:hypothetical protein